MTRARDAAPIPDQEPHPLEGKYLVFEYHEDEGEYFETFLALYHFRGGELRSIVGAFQFGSGFPDELDDKTIAFLKEKGITEVGTVHFSGDDFYGIPSRWIPTQNPDDWDEYPDDNDEMFIEVDGIKIDPIFINENNSYEKLLRENGINIIHYQREDSGKIVAIQ